jgi:hypothetical protein
MDTTQLRENFKNQLEEIDGKITKIQEELTKAQEYKLKLQGGLETLDLLSQEPENIPTPEVDVTEIEDK